MPGGIISFNTASSSPRRPLARPAQRHILLLSHRPIIRSPLKKAVKISSPAQLKKPEIPLVDSAAVILQGSQYQGMPLSAVVRDLGSVEMQSRMLEGLHKTRLTITSSSQTAAVDASALSLSAIPPSFVFSLQNDQGEAASLLPCHDLPIMAFCSTLPLHCSPSLSAETATIPVLPLRLPSPQTFHVIRDYIYNRSKVSLLSSLLSLPVEQLGTAKSSIEKLSSTELTERLRAVLGVYGNACRVGLGHDEFWKCLQIAWKVLVEASVARGKSVPTVETRLEA